MVQHRHRVALVANIPGPFQGEDINFFEFLYLMMPLGGAFDVHVERGACGPELLVSARAGTKTLEHLILFYRA